jgi:hypothetical protein
LSDLLTACVLEIDEQHKRKPISHGFHKGRSIVTNASPHTGRRFVLNLDIENFFPSINFGRVRGFLIKNNDFKLNPAVATVIAQIACNKQSLPQGSPSSPIISNLVAHILDVRLVKLAKEHKCTYTRYADDLTFSTNQTNFPKELASFSKATSTWTLGKPLITTITNAGFTVNAPKTRMQCRASRQSVTGLIVNKKVNVRSEYFKAARLMCHPLFSSGSYYRPKTTKSTTTTYQIESILSYIDQVRSSSDWRDDLTKKLEPFASKRLYERLLFFKQFVAPDKPLILCEGPSDAAYLRTAIHQLAPNFPELIDSTTSPPRLKIRFFNYRRRTKDVLGLTGGTAPIKSLMESYEKRLSTYKFRPLPFPVIVLLDNDSGTNKIFPFINGKYKLNAALNTKAKFYPICDNLYVVKTPEVGSTGESKIEDCFESALLQTSFAGKTLNPEDDKLGPNEFGKVALAGIVRANADKIVFSGFAPLLDRVVAVLKDYKKP